MVPEIAHLGLVEDDMISPDVAALELASLDHPGISLDAYCDLLSEMAEDVAETGEAVMDTPGQALALAEVIGADYGFDGDRDHYDDRENVDMIRVIDRRRGLPISLSILYVGLARRIGWRAEALNTPGHVLVRIGDETAPLLIDPFNGGTIVGTDRLASLMTQVLGADAMPSVEHLSPMSNRMMLVRLLTNEATRSEAAGDLRRALTLYERMTAVAPGNSHAWWERTRLELAHRNPAAARGSLSALLEMTREPRLRAHISTVLDSLARPHA
jgi:regulator of sirC expression with transglutaminase-like and TPR domain